MFHDAARFPFIPKLERQWPTIVAEYRAVADAAIDWFEKKLYGDGWKVLGLFDFPHGDRIEANASRCPVTTALIEEQIPRHGAAGFSILRPGTRIQPHRGYAGPYLRCHLGLIVPPGDCKLRVESEERTWEAGKAFVFDDRMTHEAWNDTAEERIILLIDFVAD